MSNIAEAAYREFKATLAPGSVKLDQVQDRQGAARDVDCPTAFTERPEIDAEKNHLARDGKIGTLYVYLDSSAT